MSFRVRRPRCAALLGATALSLWAGDASADPAPPYAALLSEARARAPRLIEAAAAVRQAEGQALQARARPNPTLGLEVENFNGGGAYSGVALAETTATLAQPLELLGKRAARVDAGRAGVAAARARQTRDAADFAFDLALAYAAAEAAQRRMTLADEAVALTGEDLRIARALVAAGREAELRVLQAQATVSEAQAQRQAARAAQVEAFARLAALSGAPDPFSSLAESLLERPASSKVVQADLASAPAVLAAVAEREAAARRVSVERTRPLPDLTVSVGVRRFNGDDATALVAGLSAPLPLFDRNRGNVASARAELSGAEARLAAARLDAEADLRTAAVQIEATAARSDAALQGEAAAAEAYRLTRTGYENGKLPLLELLNARRALAEAGARRLDAQLARVRADADLARLQGRAPFGGSSQ